MLKRFCLRSVVLAIPIAVSICCSIALAIPCNRRNAGPTQACNQNWAAAAYCNGFNQAQCGANPPNTGAANGNQGPQFQVGCPQTEAPGNHCIPNLLNCLPKFMCTNWQAGKCNPGAPVLQAGVQIWLQEEQSATENCVPHA